MLRRTLDGLLGAALLLVSSAAWAVLPFGLLRAQMEGRPHIHVGEELGYFLWMHRETLHVRWTTPRAEQHVFEGRVVLEPGELWRMRRIGLESDDRAELVTSRRALFQSRGQDGLEGVDLQMWGRARLSLTIDRVPAGLDQVFLGRGRHPPLLRGALVAAGRSGARVILP